VDIPGPCCMVVDIELMLKGSHLICWFSVFDFLISHTFLLLYRNIAGAKNVLTKSVRI
jgi:hypothetical protein